MDKWLAEFLSKMPHADTDTFDTVRTMSSVSVTHNKLSDIFEERAAILEYDSRMFRAEAERLAYQGVLAEFVRLNYPAVAAELKAILQYK